jgi:hypothetical protein
MPGLRLKTFGADIAILSEVGDFFLEKKENEKPGRW